jgi:DUF4097 and DUF4098 domain-containing protein YvlB
LTSGDIEFNDYEGDDLNINTVSGNVKVTATEFKKMNIKTISGDSNISIPKESEFKFNYETVSGNFRSNFELSRKFKDSNEMGGKNIEATIGNPGYDNIITYKSTSGDLKLIR